jgi:transposase
MARSYRPVDRAQQFLLPPDVREWLPKGHLVWLVIEVVERLDSSALHESHPNDGVGRRAYDPDMLLSLLLYSYCMGQRSSRQIERLCEVDVAYRVICCNDAPDHSTIARFRQAHELIAKKLFVEVLSVCAAAGLGRVGVIAVDGTKMSANASKKANRTRAQIEAQVEEMFAEATSADAAEDDLFGDKRGDELPEDLCEPSSRAGRLKAAMDELERLEAEHRNEQETARAASNELVARAVASGHLPGGRLRAEDEVSVAEAALEQAKRQAEAHRAAVIARAAARGRKPKGPTPGKTKRVAAAEARLAAARARTARREQGLTRQHPRRKKGWQPRVNVTDPDSRIMHTHNGWVQGYNAQAAVSSDGLVLAAELTQDHNDSAQCVPMMAATEQNLAASGITEPIGTMLFDAGYFSEDNVTAPGPDRLIATTKSWKLRRQAKEQGFSTAQAPQDAGPIKQMEHRLQSEQGYRLYAMRQHTVEPVFGQLKHDRGITSFMRRGRVAVAAEWKLMTTAHNLLKLYLHGDLSALGI